MIYFIYLGLNSTRQIDYSVNRYMLSYIISGTNLIRLVRSLLFFYPAHITSVIA